MHAENTAGDPDNTQTVATLTSRLAPDITSRVYPSRPWVSGSLTDARGSRQYPTA